MEKSLQGDEEKLERLFDHIAYLEKTRGGVAHDTLKDLHGSTVDEIIATVDEEAKKTE